MTSTAHAPAAGRAPRGRPGNGAYVTRSIAWTLLAVLASLTNLVYSPLGAGEPGVLLVLVAFPAALAVPGLLWWRRRAPIAVTLLAAALGILLPIGAVTAWIALVGAFKRRDGAPVWWSALVVLAATVAAVLRDLSLPPTGGLLGGLVHSWSGTGAPPVGAGSGEPWLGDLPWYTAPVVAAGMMVFVVGAGLLARAASRTRRAEERSVAAGARTVELGGALARQQEREQIAREVHDGLGQRLSIVAMHAGALSVSTGLSDEARGTAELLRASAAEAADDLRSLLRVLRQNEELPPVPLRQLERLIGDFELAGLPVRARVAIAEPDEAPAPLARAVVRIVQELLTNARKHAGGELLHLRVTGGPPGPGAAGGIVVEAQNLLPAPGSARARPSGFGLQGIAERVERLGGRLRYGLDPTATSFLAEVHLPWPARASDSVSATPPSPGSARLDVGGGSYTRHHDDSGPAGR